MIPRESDIRKKKYEEERPWGFFKRYVFDEKCTVKIITINPNQKLSSQAHKKRDELWVILDEGLRVELDDQIIEPKPGDEIVILRNVTHRLSSLGLKGRVLEISFGDFDENDVERFDDMYGRE